MSSYGKTAAISLNQWAATDPVLRDDFNLDNQKTDRAIGGIAALMLQIPGVSVEALIDVTGLSADAIALPVINNALSTGYETLEDAMNYAANSAAALSAIIQSPSAMSVIIRSDTAAAALANSSLKVVYENITIPDSEAGTVIGAGYTAAYVISLSKYTGASSWNNHSRCLITDSRIDGKTDPDNRIWTSSNGTTEPPTPMRAFVSTVRVGVQYNSTSNGAGWGCRVVYIPIM